MVLLEDVVVSRSDVPEDVVCSNSDLPEDVVVGGCELVHTGGAEGADGREVGQAGVGGRAQR
jgi:hypothetical protein